MVQAGIQYNQLWWYHFLSLDPPGANGIRFQLPKKGLKPAQPFSGQKRFHSPYGHKGKNNDLQNQDGHQQGFISDNKNQMSANQRWGLLIFHIPKNLSGTKLVLLTFDLVWFFLCREDDKQTDKKSTEPSVQEWPEDLK